MSSRKPAIFTKVAVIGVCAGSVVWALLSSLPAQSQAPAARSQALTFGLIGDLAYNPAEEPLLQNVFDDLNRNALAFVVHLGDLSSPRYACTDEILTKRLGQFNASVHPLIFTPGDNDWTDCHEKQGVAGGDPLVRLAKVRSMFFVGERSLGKRTMALTRQSKSKDPALAKFRENAMWEANGVTFATLHIVGSNNGLGRSADGDAEYAERNQANLAWLREAFAHAKSRNSRAIMIIQQANIFPAHYPTAGSPAKDPHGFTDTRILLEKEVMAYDKPIVFVHGDSHFFRIDKPLPVRAQGSPVLPSLENFTRVETFGSPNHHWVEATIDRADPNVFKFRQRIVSANIRKRLVSDAR
jgi:hypothetical protein